MSSLLALHIIAAQIRKELRQIVRDRVALVLAVLLPQLLLVLLSVSLSLTIVAMPVVINTLDVSPIAHDYVDAIRNSLSFRVVANPQQNAEEVLKQGIARAVIVIPSVFSHDLHRKGAANIQILVDATDAATAELVGARLEKITHAFVASRGFSPAPVLADMRFWHNPGLESAKFMAPGALSFCLALFPALLACIAMSREREQGTLVQVRLAGMSFTDFLAGKILAYTVVGLAQWLLSMIVIVVSFDLQPRGSLTLLSAATLLYVACSASFGIVIGTVSDNQAAAIQGVQLTGFILSLLFSGFIFPIVNMPRMLQWFSMVVPARYYTELARGSFLRGAGWPTLWHIPVALVALGGLFLSPHDTIYDRERQRNSAAVASHAKRMAVATAQPSAADFSRGSANSAGYSFRLRPQSSSPRSQAGRCG